MVVGAADGLHGGPGLPGVHVGATPTARACSTSAPTTACSTPSRRRRATRPGPSSRSPSLPKLADDRRHGVLPHLHRRPDALGGGREVSAAPGTPCSWAAAAKAAARYFALDVTVALLAATPVAGDACPTTSRSPPRSSSRRINGTAVALIGSGLDDTTGRAYLDAYRVSDGAHPRQPPAEFRRQRAQQGDRRARRRPGSRRQPRRRLHRRPAGPSLARRVRRQRQPGHLGRHLPVARHHYEVTATPAPGATARTATCCVYFGTGAYLETADIATTEQNIFCCVYRPSRRRRERDPGRPDQLDPRPRRTTDGWYVRLEHADGERVTEPAVAVAGTVLFTSFEPSSQLCTAGGASWLWRMNYTDGGVPDDGEDDGWDGGRSIELGEGIASRPVVDVVNETVIVQSSDASITVAGHRTGVLPPLGPLVAGDLQRSEPVMAGIAGGHHHARQIPPPRRHGPDPRRADRRERRPAHPRPGFQPARPGPCPPARDAGPPNRFVFKSGVLQRDHLGALGAVRRHAAADRRQDGLDRRGARTTPSGLPAEGRAVRIMGQLGPGGLLVRHGSLRDQGRWRRACRWPRSRSPTPPRRCGPNRGVATSGGPSVRERRTRRALGGLRYRRSTSRLAPTVAADNHLISDRGLITMVG